MARKNRRIPTPLSGNDSVGEIAKEASGGFRIVVFADDEDRRPFLVWLHGLRDRVARVRINGRLIRITQGGNFGDHRERIAGAISELRIDYGLGYRIYYVLHGNTLVILFGGGTKDSQTKDIETAFALWKKYGNEIDRHTRDLEG